MKAETGRAPRVSIGLPVRNGGRLLPRALSSVLDQTERDIEVIASDNGSDDGTTELLKAAAAADPRVRYFRHDRPLRALENFYFVLGKARGEYFMWAAHDDSRDLDYAGRLADALDGDPDAVLAFGDLAVITADGPTGEVRPLPFQTSGMTRLARMAKLSRMQCYYIYGVWRTATLRRIPYAYCQWWSDLPIVLGASVLGTFIHVPGTHFQYMEVQKTAAEMLKANDFLTQFSLVRGVANLVLATFRSCRGVGGLAVGTYAASLVILKQAVNLPGFLFRRLQRGLTA
jgi:glycosyltransferase involved in cell wall biosynthesis